MLLRLGASIAVVLALLAAPAVAGPVLLFEPATGKVLYAEDQDNLWHPASLTKIMTAYLTLDALKAGRLKPDQKIVVSEKANEQTPSKIGLGVGNTISVELALQALVVKSANDAAVMLAEAIAGSEEDFAKLMNDTARRLGMTRTHFANANGLPAPEQVTTARDLARLATAVIRDFPERSALWAQTEVLVGKKRLRTHNGLLKTFQGADGMKTGFICDAGYNVVASATRDGRRLVAVVLGEMSGRERSVRAASLLEHGFQTYGWKQLFNSTTVESLPVGDNPKTALSVRQQVHNWACNGRRTPRAVAKRARRPVASARKKEPAATKGPTTAALPAPKADTPKAEAPKAKKSATRKTAPPAKATE